MNAQPDVPVLIVRNASDGYCLELELKLTQLDDQYLDSDEFEYCLRVELFANAECISERYFGGSGAISENALVDDLPNAFLLPYASEATHITVQFAGRFDGTPLLSIQHESRFALATLDHNNTVALPLVNDAACSFALQSTSVSALDVELTTLTHKPRQTLERYLGYSPTNGFVSCFLMAKDDGWFLDGVNDSIPLAIPTEFDADSKHWIGMQHIAVSNADRLLVLRLSDNLVLADVLESSISKAVFLESDSNCFVYWANDEYKCIDLDTLEHGTVALPSSINDPRNGQLSVGLTSVVLHWREGIGLDLPSSKVFAHQLPDHFDTSGFAFQAADLTSVSTTAIAEGAFGELCEVAIQCASKRRLRTVLLPLFYDYEVHFVAENWCMVLSRLAFLIHTKTLKVYQLEHASGNDFPTVFDDSFCVAVKDGMIEVHYNRLKNEVVRITILLPLG